MLYSVPWDLHALALHGTAFRGTAFRGTAFRGTPQAQRTLVVAFVLALEALLASTFLDGATLLHKNGFLTGLVREHGAWVVKGCIGFAVLFATFAYLRYKGALAMVSDRFAQEPLRPALFAAHFVAIALFGFLSAALYGSRPASLPMDFIAAGWFLAGAAAIAFAGLAVGPWQLWVTLIRTTRQLWIYAAAASFAACLAGAMSWRLWEPASRLTFYMVKSILRPFLSGMIVEPAAMTIGTHRFTAIISSQCSGLEGIALMLIFGAVWLVLFRHEIRFPQALALVPAGVVVLFLLNAVRIAALIVIGNAGAREIAARGFHSQAGWIAFNSVAFGFSVIARRVPWFSAPAYRSETTERSEAAVDYPAAPYLLPLLAILAAGMISTAATGRFEWTYPLRLLAALLTLCHRCCAEDMRMSIGSLAGSALRSELWCLRSGFLPISSLPAC